MLWLLSSLAFAWNLHDVQDFCSEPPDTSGRAWEDSEFNGLMGRGTTLSEEYFDGSYALHFFRDEAINIVGITLDANSYEHSLKHVNHQLIKRYHFVDDGMTKYFSLDSSFKNLPYIVFIFQDTRQNVLLLVGCGNGS